MRSLPGYHANASKGFKDAWDRLFNEHRDLSSGFIHGLQAGPGQLGSVSAYFASSTPVAGGVGGNGGGEGEGLGRGEAMRGQEKEKGGKGWRLDGDKVLIKEEGTDETKVLDEAKKSRV